MRDALTRGAAAAAALAELPDRTPDEVEESAEADREARAAVANARTPKPLQSQGLHTRCTRTEVATVTDQPRPEPPPVSLLTWARPCPSCGATVWLDQHGRLRAWPTTSRTPARSARGGRRDALAERDPLAGLVSPAPPPLVGRPVRHLLRRQDRDAQGQAGGRLAVRGAAMSRCPVCSRPGQWTR